MFQSGKEARSGGENCTSGCRFKPDCRKWRQKREHKKRIKKRKENRRKNIKREKINRWRDLKRRK